MNSLDFLELTTNDAQISLCGKYRYWLSRKSETEAPEKPAAVFVMLNPSTANASLDDPTIRRCRGFAKTWGCNGLIVINLYALRSPRPVDLWVSGDPVGPYNDFWLSTMLKDYPDICCAWGANAKPDRVKTFLKIAEQHNAALWCLGTNKDGSPKHPLYIPAQQSLARWPE